MNYDGYFQRALARLRDERRYRVFADLERIAGRYPSAIWHSPAGPRNVVIFVPTTISRWGSTRR
jgi:5-aminolevulinate synthase